MSMRLALLILALLCLAGLRIEGAPPSPSTGLSWRKIPPAAQPVWLPTREGIPSLFLPGLDPWTVADSAASAHHQPAIARLQIPCQLPVKSARSQWRAASRAPPSRA
jgi:hypothetical protein